MHAYPDKVCEALFMQVLKGISLEVAPGRKVALVGTSGGGKTTIVNLVERFYDPHRGCVLFDGLPLTDIDHDYLHQQVGCYPPPLHCLLCMLMPCGGWQRPPSE